MEERNNSKLGAFFIALAGIGFGSAGYFVHALSEMGASGPMVSLSSQLFAIIPAFLIVLFKRGLGGFKISKEGLIASIIMGIFTKGIFVTAYSTSITLVGVSTGAILLYLSPLFTSILSRIFFKERLKNYQYLALGLNLLGCILVVTKGYFTKLNLSSLGIILGLFASFLYALNTIIGKASTSKDDPLTMTFYVIIFAGLTIMFFARPWDNLSILLDKRYIFYGSLNGILTGALASLFLYKGLSMGVKASKVPVIASVEVIAATLVGVFLLDEYMNLVGLLGIFILLSSIVLMNYENKGDEI